MFFQILSGLLLIILGILAVPSLILSKRPDAETLLHKIRPYQGWIGIFFVIIGLLGIINAVLSLAKEIYPIYWFIGLLVSLMEASLGFIMGYSLIASKLLSKNEAAEEKGRSLLSTLLPIQGKLGIAAVVLGIIQIVIAFVY